MAGQKAEDAAAGNPETNDFSTALRVAISASGLSLDRIQARLKSRGVSVSVTALSYWQSGKRQPERGDSLAAVRELETILGLAPGSLLGLLKAPRPRGSAAKQHEPAPADTLQFSRDVVEPLLLRIGAPNALDQHQQLTLVGLHDSCEIAADGGQRALRTRAVFQANADRQDRWLLVYDQDDPSAEPPTLHALRNCRVGRTETDKRHGIIAAELLFNRKINRDETFLIEYSLTNEGPPFPACQNKNWREFRRKIREYLLEVRFDFETTPQRCWQYSRSASDDSSEWHELAIDPANGVHAVALDFGPGVFGIEWA
ncbi:MAG: hypothetical protein GEU98_16645 [Pseudonocardiaceae bacterium]|nr:hypothetical protein [Pseudonocardiaceae bacterium]